MPFIIEYSSTRYVSEALKANPHSEGYLARQDTAARFKSWEAAEAWCIARRRYWVTKHRNIGRVPCASPYDHLCIEEVEA